MQGGHRNRYARHAPAWVLCFVLSVLLHAGLALLLIQYAEPPTPTRAPGKRARVIAIVPPQQKNRAAQSTDKKEKPFAKTDADRPQQIPEQADFEGQRDTRAEGMNQPSRQAQDPIPTQDGEDKPYFNHLQQERQDGDVAHYGKNDAPPTQAPPQTPTQQPLPQPPPQKGQADAAPIPTTSPAPEQAAPQTISPPKDAAAPDSALTLYLAPQDDTEKPTPISPAQAALGSPENQGTFPAIPRPPIVKAYYDPTQADHAQPPGLRTAERRTRSTGQFIIGKRPSLNVEATPRGQYEELVYRLIARQWYKACDDHRGDVIPGTIMIAIRINTRGQTTTMNLVNRRGAGVSQQSFTFAAIRRAQFPPMPKAVVDTLAGDQMELIITFDFN